MAILDGESRALVPSNVGASSGSPIAPVPTVAMEVAGL